jgi:hypothetical protein
MAWAVRRALNGLNTKVQAIMKERFTVLHPSVEWRFRQMAMQVAQGLSVGEDLVFPNVYPLFGVSDVRRSTVTRNTAIAADFDTQLKLAHEVIRAGMAVYPMDYFEALLHRIERWRSHLELGLNSEDESQVMEFIRKDVEPVFDSLETLGGELEEKLRAYYRALDRKLRIVYQQRKRYEDSITLLKDSLAHILTEAQAKVQAIHPHYFELRKTDGVDHTIYVGASIHPQGKYDPVFLKNLRLWQLETMIEIARKSSLLMSRMPMALETAHLILVQDSPLSIRFSSEEKQFNVDGAYNARYEILKKRVDKAEVRGTGERLTQPGQIAIVYSHPREAAEYRDFIDYLQSVGQLSCGLEELELTALQGVAGLKALRVTATSA